jgi:hypothetical protein
LREIAALKPSTVLLVMALSVSVVQSFPVLGKKEYLYISVVAESTLICLLLDVLDGRWLEATKCKKKRTKAWPSFQNTQ